MKPIAWISVDKNGEPVKWCKPGFLDPEQWANPTADSDACDTMSPELAPHKTIPLYALASLPPEHEPAALPEIRVGEITHDGKRPQLWFKGKPVFGVEDYDAATDAHIADFCKTVGQLRAEAERLRERLDDCGKMLRAEHDCHMEAHAECERLRVRAESAEAALRERNEDARVIADTLEAIDNRCMAADGPVTPTLQEATASELRKIYTAAKRIDAARKEKK